MIVVVGAGIGGLAAALALARTAEVVVLERRAAFASNAGAGIQLAPNAMKALAALGVAEPVRALAHAPAGLRLTAGRRTVTRLAYDGAFEARFGAPSLTATRAALHAALLAAAEAHPAVTVRTGLAVETVRAEGSGWRVPEVDGRIRLLVAADGVNSTIRRRLVGDDAVETGWIAWRGRGPHHGDGDTCLAMARGAHLVRYGMGAEETNAVYVAAERAGTPGAAGGPLGEALGALHDWVPWPVLVRRRHVFALPRLAFVGDAAHAMRPFLAQGAAMALEDAAVLGAALVRHDIGEAALAAYRNARHPRTKRAAWAALGQGAIYHLPPPASFARDAAMTRLGPAGILGRVDWLYGWSPP